MRQNPLPGARRSLTTPMAINRAMAAGRTNKTRRTGWPGLRFGGTVVRHDRLSWRVGIVATSAEVAYRWRGEMPRQARAAALRGARMCWRKPPGRECPSRLNAGIRGRRARSPLGFLDAKARTASAERAAHTIAAGAAFRRSSHREAIRAYAGSKLRTTSRPPASRSSRRLAVIYVFRSPRAESGE